MDELSSLPKKKWIGSPPKECQLCNAAIVKMFIDGRIKGHSSWGYMCLECWQFHGVGFGIGLGQQYELQNGEWVKING